MSINSRTQRSPRNLRLNCSGHADLKRGIVQSASDVSTKIIQWTITSPLETLKECARDLNASSSRQINEWIESYEEPPPAYSSLRTGRNIFLVTRAIRSATSIDSAYKAGSWCDTFGHWFVVFGNAPTFDTGFEVTGDGVMSQVNTAGLKTTMKIYVGSTSLSDDELASEAAATWNSFNAYNLHRNNCQNFATAFIHRIADQDLNEYAWPLRFSRFLAWTKAIISALLIVWAFSLLRASFQIHFEIPYLQYGLTPVLQINQHRQGGDTKAVLSLLLPFLILTWMIKPFFLRREGFFIEPVKTQGKC